MALTFAEGTTEYTECPEALWHTKVSDEVDARIKAALNEWVLRIRYYVTYEDEDDEPYTASDIRYKVLHVSSQVEKTQSNTSARTPKQKRNRQN